jgi:hypothetical protein
VDVNVQISSILIFGIKMVFFFIREICGKGNGKSDAYTCSVEHLEIIKPWRLIVSDARIGRAFFLNSENDSAIEYGLQTIICSSCVIVCRITQTHQVHSGPTDLTV